MPNDLMLRMPWGYCCNETWNRNGTAERLAALELMAGGRTRESDLDISWKNLLVGQHHDVQICGLLPEARRFLGESRASSARVRQASLDYLAAHLRASGMAPITVFNPYSWRAPQWVEATFDLPRHSARAFEVRSGGKPVPAVLIDALRAPDDSLPRARLVFRADAPPLGVAAYFVARSGSAPAPPDRFALDGLCIAARGGRLDCPPAAACPGSPARALRW